MTRFSPVCLIAAAAGFMALTGTAQAMPLGDAIAQTPLTGLTVVAPAQDPLIFARRGRGADDAPGHIRHGHGADDPAGHA